MSRRDEVTGLPLSAARWRLEAAKVPAGGLDLDLAASEAELKALASVLDLLELETLHLAGRLVQLSRGRFRLEATLSARAVQRCVATLEPVPAEIEEEIDCELSPPDAIASPRRHIDIDAGAEEPEPIEDGFIPVGRLAYETLSLALPPYPRSAEAAGVDAGAGDPLPDNPFAVLKSLKKPV